MKKATILCVNDNPKSTRLLSSILEERGFHVIGAEGADEARQIAETTSFDLALLDYAMPKMLGTELAKEIRIVEPHVPIVVMSGLASLPDEELLYVDAHVGRGSTLEDLIEMVSTLIGSGETVVEAGRGPQFRPDWT